MYKDYITANFLVLQALYWGKLTIPEIYKWIKDECLDKDTFSIKLSRLQIKRAIKYLLYKRLIELHESNEGQVSINFERRDLYRITDSGRAELRSVREALKVIFSRPPAHLVVIP